MFRRASEKDNQMRARISSLISSGKYRHHNLSKEISKATKQISHIFTSDQYAKENDNKNALDLPDPYNIPIDQPNNVFLTQNTNRHSRQNRKNHKKLVLKEELDI